MLVQRAERRHPNLVQFRGSVVVAATSRGVAIIVGFLVLMMFSALSPAVVMKSFACILTSFGVQFNFRVCFARWV